MKKVDLGQMITLLANIGVIAGIVFLGIELQQNNELLEAQARFNHKETRATFTAVARDNESFAEVLVKAEAGEDLSRIEQMRLDAHWDQMFVAYEWEFFESQTGGFEIPVAGWRDSLRNRPGSAERWEQTKFRFRPEFTSWFDANVAFP